MLCLRAQTHSFDVCNIDVGDDEALNGNLWCLNPDVKRFGAFQSAESSLGGLPVKSKSFLFS